jgi:hypothetical protein
LSPQNYRQAKKQREAAQKARQLKKLQRRQKPEGSEGSEGPEASALDDKSAADGVEQPTPGSAVDAE